MPFNNLWRKFLNNSNDLFYIVLFLQWYLYTSTSWTFSFPWLPWYWPNRFSSSVIFCYRKWWKCSKAHLSFLFSLYPYSLTELRGTTANSGQDCQTYLKNYLMFQSIVSIESSLYVLFTLEKQYSQPKTITMSQARWSSYVHYIITTISFFQSWEYYKALEIMRWSLYQIAHF